MGVHNGRDARYLYDSIFRAEPRSGGWPAIRDNGDRDPKAKLALFIEAVLWPSRKAVCVDFEAHSELAKPEVRSSFSRKLYF